MLLKYYSVVILCFSFVNGEEPGEPKCFSRFDYDEKMLMKQLRFEDKVQKFEDFINGIKAREAKEKEKRDKLFALELEKVKKFNNGAKAREAREKEERDKLFAAELEKAKNFQRLINEVKTREEKEFRGGRKVVAFTVTQPKKGATSTSMSFTKVITNEGNAFDTSTGKFTCPVSGLYYFSLHIIKRRSPSIGYAGCYIKLNGTDKVIAFNNPQDGSNGADYGNLRKSSTSVYLIKE
ncbi:uncharacterized protein LOC132759521 [Ruditapes philippinarum]|uniref:uncharacterized protein LOC132759521 n=1 Tax=Ruditapes philippinarum TaxID=129788 RepID=UPI00295C1E6B|nr:uncharacterized protein LOC132759521 [Ruditapes philippinarum]